MLPEFEGVTDVASAHRAFRTWMFDRALPFWGSAGQDAGLDGAGLGAREHLRLDGSPADVDYKRTRVQARQIYAFSHAALLGWDQGAQLAEGGYRFLTRSAELADGGWVRRVSRGGEHVLDPAIDLYDQAFVLFALAWYARMSGKDEPLALARRTTEWILAHMRQPPQGYHNILPKEAGPRQQNPHMHLLEASLALHETSGETLYSDLAHELVELFRDRLFDPQTSALGEFFTDAWAPMAGEAGDHVEPGHQFEWAWILDRYERLTGSDVTSEIEALYACACAHGVDPQSAMVWDQTSRAGQVLQRSTRLWPQTESLKARAIMVGRRGADPSAIPKIVRNLGTYFLAGCPQGAWIDQLDAAGRPAADKIPTSSFYHLFMAYAELERLAKAQA